MKTLGLGLLVAACAFLGARLAGRLRKREDMLAAWLLCAACMEDAMLYWGDELAAAWDKVCQTASSPIRGILCLARDAAGGNCADNLAALLPKHAKTLAMSPDDMRIVCSFLDGLGMQSAEQLQLRFDRLRNALQAQGQEAKERRAPRERMVRSMGLLCGLAIAILLA